MTITDGDSVTIEFTGRLADGTIFDTTREAVAEESGLADAQPGRAYDPLTVEIGADQIIEGLEEALRGLEEGETHTVTIPPGQGYGEWSEEGIREYDAEEFRDLVGGQTPEEGDYLETQEGGIAEVAHADEQLVRVDFNHQLAGETLEFDLEVVDVS